MAQTCSALCTVNMVESDIPAGWSYSEWGSQDEATPFLVLWTSMHQTFANVTPQ